MVAHAKAQTLQRGRRISGERFLKIPPDGGTTDKRRKNWKEPNSEQPADNQFKLARVQPKLKALQEPNASAVGQHGSAEGQWHKYFAERTEWCDHKKNLQPTFPDSRHNSVKEAFWMHSRKTSKWVTQTKENTLFRNAEGGSLRRGRTFSNRTGNAVDLKALQHDTFLWNSLISKHTRCGQDRQALRIYYEMREVGVRPNSYTFVAALKACSSLQDMETATQIHAEVIQTGMGSILHIGNTLVNVYAKCGSLMHARSVFERMPQRDVVSWNAMILGYVQLELGEDALNLYARMQQERVEPDDRTYVGVLKACGSLAASDKQHEGEGIIVRERCLEQVRTIHSQVMKTGSALSLFIGTMLVDVYGKCGSLPDATHVFQNMPCRNVVSWNAMILGCSQLGAGEGALQLYAQMQHEGVVPDDRTFLSALKACSTMAVLEGENETNGKRVRDRCLVHVRAIHLDVMKSASHTNVFVGTMLVDAYAKCRSLLDARHVFEKMPHRNVVSWNAMIWGYTEMEEGGEALKLYTQMQQEGVVPNDRTFVSVLKACSSLAVLAEGNEADRCVKQQCLEQVEGIHLHIMKTGFDADVFVGTMLVDAYAKCGSLQSARYVFEKMHHRSVVPWNAVILGYALMGQGEEALELFARMQQEGVVPDNRTFVGALKACISLAAVEDENEACRVLAKQRCLERVRAIHSQVLKREALTAVFVSSMLVNVYARCGSLMEARHVFDTMPNRDVASWNAIILGYAHFKEGKEALRLYTQMQHEGVEPDDQTYVAALKACCSVAGLGKGKDIHAQILKNGAEDTDSFVASSLIDMYGKCGSMTDAQQIFDTLMAKDVVTWNALIAGYARQGESELVFDLFERMILDGIQPSHITFLSVLTLCSHVGLLDQGQKYFEAMTNDYGISPTIDHYTCMVDLFGRAGQLNRAMEMVKSMPFEPHGDVWKSVLGACQKWNNVELGRRAFESAVRLDRNDAAAYVLMSNIYTAADMQEDANEIHARRVKARAWKKPGQSWGTDVGGVLHTFAVGD